MMTREEAAEILGISTRTLDRYVRKKMLKPHRRGRRTMFVRIDVESLMEAPATRSHVVSHSQPNETLPDTPSPDMTAFAGLIREMNEQIQKKDAHIAHLNFEMGKLQESVHNSVPLLEMRNEKESHQQHVIELQEEVGKAKTGRLLFFILFAVSAGVIGILGNLLMMLE